MSETMYAALVVQTNRARKAEQELMAAQLHIKELREALYLLRHRIYMGEDGAFNVADDALSKQPDTRALDKALLEARIEELTFAYGQTKSGFIDNRVGRYEDKLAELNNEIPE